jgi:DNA (cytosine-5)-methyltransferase 1
MRRDRDYKITDDRREQYRQASIKSALRKRESRSNQEIETPKIYTPRLDPAELMPEIRRHSLKAISLFSGGGGLDVGFDRAGFMHAASYEIIDICGETLTFNRPRWKIFSGETDGDVRNIDWSIYRREIDVIHGGPPCQPFSTAGQQLGKDDERNMWGPFVKIVTTIAPRAFIAENVPGLLDSKFRKYVENHILRPLSGYHIRSFVLHSAGFGVPQQRKRVFFVGFKEKTSADQFEIPAYTHRFDHLITARNSQVHRKQQPLFWEDNLQKTMGLREALGLPSIGVDGLCPTIRSAFTGKRNTTSILNSTAAAKNLAKLEIWGSGVSASREEAARFLTENGHFRLSVQDCSLIQGFPKDWIFQGAVYKILGQIGNSVCPPVAYQVAKSVKNALMKT